MARDSGNSGGGSTSNLWHWVSFANMSSTRSTSRHSCGGIPAQQVGKNSVFFPKETKQNFISVLSVHYTVLGINSLLQSVSFYSISGFICSQMVTLCVSESNTTEHIKLAFEGLPQIQQIGVVEFIPLEIPYSCRSLGSSWNLKT